MRSVKRKPITPTGATSSLNAALLAVAEGRADPLAVVAAAGGLLVDVDRGGFEIGLNDIVEAPGMGTVTLALGP